MSDRDTRATGEGAKAAEAWRNRGYQDALAGRERQSREPEYLKGYRGGLQRLANDAGRAA